MLRPFSHTPGQKVLIPSTSHLVEAFPTYIRYGGKELTLDVKGPVKNFTVVQDLERVCVTIFSELYRFHILPNLELVQDKLPKSPLQIFSKLDFGMHKKLEWELIKRRLDFREIFPLWFRLGQLLNLPSIDVGSEGTFALLQEIQKTVANRRPELLMPLFEKLFLAGFSHLFVPRSEDNEHQGIVFGNSETPPLYLLTEGAKLIRSLFIEADESTLSLLPNCPPELFCGKLEDLETPFGLLNLEWSKKQLRSVALFPSHSCELKIQFPAGLKQFRLRTSLKEKGVIHSCQRSLLIESTQEYFLDRFLK